MVYADKRGMDNRRKGKHQTSTGRGPEEIPMSDKPHRDAVEPEAEGHAEMEADLRSERQADALMRLVADRAFNELVPDDPRNVPFFEWLSRELRQRKTRREREETERHAIEFTKRVKRRLAVRVLRIREEAGAAPRHAAPVDIRTAEALELAIRSAKAPYLDLAVAAGTGRELWDEECVEWVDIPADLPPGKHLALRVSGDSMTPVLHDGDTLLVRLGDTLEPGRVVVAYRPDEGYVVKQLGRIGRRELELVSLNEAFPPIRVPRGPGAILGTVVLRWCAHGAAAG
jgi:phage repressor protein C with HTH and peptisase S24 domain